MKYVWVVVIDNGSAKTYHTRASLVRVRVNDAEGEVMATGSYGDLVTVAGELNERPRL